MNRRDFLKNLGAAAVSSVVPKPLQKDARIEELEQQIGRYDWWHNFLIDCIEAVEKRADYWKQQYELKIECCDKMREQLEGKRPQDARWDHIGVYNGKMILDPAGWEGPTVRYFGDIANVYGPDGDVAWRIKSDG